MGNAWSTAIDTIRGALETDTKRTALEQPGTIAQLPAALRAEQKPWPSLVAPGKLNLGFFVLLAAKAHFLIAPEANRRVHAAQQQGAHLGGRPGPRSRG